MSKLRRRDILGGIAGAGGLAALPRLGQATPSPQIDLERAKAQGPVILYTSLDTQIVDEVIAGFRARYGIDVTYFRSGSAEVTGRVLAEADAGSVRADLVDASDLASLLVMKERGLLRPFASAAMAHIDPALRDPDQTWIADRLTQCIIQYNTKEFGARPPRSWRDLADPAYRGRLAFFSSANGDGAPRLYNLAKAFGWDLLEAYAANEPMRVQTPQLITQIIESGERGAGFANNDNIAWRSRRQGKPTDYLYCAEGVPTEAGGFGLLEGSPRMDAAMLFYEWWMGAEGQAILVKGGKYSPRADIAPPPDCPPLKDIKLLTLDYAEYKDNREDILQRMADTFGGEWGI